MSDEEREPRDKRPGPPDDDELDEFYDAEDAAEDTGDSEDIVAEAWETAREDAEGTPLAPEESNPPRDLLDVATVPFDDLQNLGADDADLVGGDPDISGQEDIEEIDIDTDLDTDEDVSTRDVGTHDVGP